jgi:hypothetical protein
MDFEIAKSVFESLYSEVNGCEISSSARKKISYTSKVHTYGEVTPEGFSAMLKELQIAPTGVFYDLGSGTGKGVILVSLFGNFTKMIGIEILEDLYLESKKILSRYEETVHPILPDMKKQQTLDFIHGDFLEQDITNADVIFSHSTCFYDELMLALERRCLGLKSEEYPMTWGKATVNFYEKVE